MSIESSYKKFMLEYGTIFQLLVGLHKPKNIIEFGILQGYSLMHFISAAKELKHPVEIVAYDIFDDFNGKHATTDVIKKFEMYSNVSIKNGDFYKIFKEIPGNSVDFFHIDIANDGEVYEFAIDNYLPKLSEKGIMILEGGSVERDRVEWMKKYNKTSIRNCLEKRGDEFNYLTINIFPSMTIIWKK